ncbi:ABC transporter ATP-binding protein [Sporichthya brevicatena]|uniref:ABC transporter ATP-binding protein n=1 Tax=Sporichthya brevicatena TaxID=171442 RepID=A0ABN1GRC2_9ACTN
MLELRRISAGYTGAAVLHDVDLIVPAGSTVALLGPNGAGKTTLLRVAGGTLRPMRGQILVDGSDVTGRQPHDLVRYGVCTVPEGRAVFPNLSVRENLTLFADGHSSALDLAVEAFPTLGRRMNQRAGSMSGGEQQMVALARAYLQNPRLVLLDEVSMGLAPVVVDEVFEFLATVRERGASLLLVEQYVGKALALADYVVLLARGRVQFVGEPQELDEEKIFSSYAGLESAGASSAQGVPR